MIGEILGEKYQVEEEVGQGGMSVVYRGVDTVLKRPVAIKVLHPHLSSRKDSRERFEREALAIAKLSHPNILQIFDFSERDDRKSFIVTEFIQGSTLRDFIDTHPIDHPELAAMVGVKLCDALDHAHELGIIHRDIKPENVMICEDGVVKLMDFGIAQIVGSHTMTVTGTLLGSPAHMSPEMIEGLPVDFRADVFSLGTLIYYCATGELPFTGPNPPLVLKSILEGDYVPAEMVNPRVGRRLSRLLDRCLARHAQDRFESIAALRDALLGHLEDVGLQRVDDWLPAFFIDPEDLHARIRPHLLEALERRGRESLREKRVAAALEYFNRVLAIEPEHEVVLGLIRRIDRRRKLYVYSAVAAIFAVVGGVIWWASTLPDPPPDPVKPAVVDPVVEAREVALGDSGRLARQTRLRAISVADEITDSRTLVYEAVVESWVRLASARDLAQIDIDNLAATASRPERDAGRSRPPRSDAGSAAPPVADVGPKLAKTVLVRFVVSPSTATVDFNGRSYSRLQWSQGIKVPTGLISYTIRHADCQPKKGTVVADGSRPAITVRREKLQWKPAWIVVRDRGGDEGAAVQVFDGGTKIASGKVGRRMRVPIVDPLLPSRNVRVIVVPSKKGGSVRRLPASVYAGKTASLDVNL